MGLFLLPRQIKGLHVAAQVSCLAWDRTVFRVETRRTRGSRRRQLFPLVWHIYLGYWLWHQEKPGSEREVC